MGITVRPGENAYWGPHVFFEGSGEAEEIRDAYARESADWPPLHFAVAEAKPEALDPWYRLGYAQMHGGKAPIDRVSHDCLSCEVDEVVDWVRSGQAGMTCI